MNPSASVRTRESGLIGLLVILFLALILAKYIFNWSVFEAAGTPQGHDTISYGQSLSLTIWHYITLPFVAIWQKALEPALMSIWKAL